MHTHTHTHTFGQLNHYFKQKKRGRKEKSIVPPSFSSIVLTLPESRVLIICLKAEERRENYKA